MKKSLSIISLTLLGCLMACHPKPTTSSNNSTGSSNTSGTKKDTAKTTTDGKAVIHGSQNQAQLDSIKAAKTKGKK
jgi:maltose-binding protein MalE